MNNVCGQHGERGHVLMIAPTPFFADRGCHVRILEEVRAMTRHGYRVTVCTYHLGDDVEGLTIRRSVRIPWYRKLSAGPSWHKLYIDLLLLGTVLRACLGDRPALIHGHLHEGIAIGKIAGALLRIPLVVDLQGSLVGEMVQHRFIKPTGLLHKLFACVERFLLRLPRHIVLSSHRALDNVIEPSRLMTATTVIADGVDTDVFTPRRTGENLRDRLSLPGDVKLIGYLGLLKEYQGVSVMMRTAQQVLAKRQDVHWLVMGYPDVDRYRAMAADLGIDQHVTFTGRLPYDRARDYLAACDLAFSAKQDVTEANGKLLNYMAVGLATVATDTPVNRELLTDCAVYGRVDDPASLADAVLQLLHDDAYAADLGRRARRRVETELSWQAGGRRLAEVYQRVLR